MVRRGLLLTLPVLVATAFCVPAFSGEVIAINGQGLSDIPPMLPRFTDASWGIDFRDNPALLSLETPYRLILDGSYTGGNRHLSMDSYGRVGSFGGIPGGHSAGYREMDYYTHRLGGDAGLAVRLAEGTDLAGLVTYRWDHLSGSGYFANESHAAGGLFSVFYGNTEERLDAYTFGLSVLLSREVDRTFTLGAGLRYAYRTETSRLDESGFGFDLGWGPENAIVSKDLTLHTHEIAPVIGVRFRPSERFTLDGCLEAGFTVGGVSKDSFLSDDALFPLAYSEDLDSSNLFGWRLTAELRPEFAITDNLSVPVVLGASYRNLSWSVDGVGIGTFTPRSYLDFYYGEGTIEYENSVTAWDWTVGAGLTYRGDWGVVSSLLSYTHKNLRNAYDQENFGALIFGGMGLTALGTRDTEIRDVLSLSLSLEKEFSKALAADVGLRYDVGWARRDYYLTYSTPYETVALPAALGPAQLMIDTDGRDTYQDLTLTVDLMIRPLDRLSLVLGGMVRVPLDPLDYELDGDAAGLEGALPLILRLQTYYSGPHARGIETTGWDWGGWFYLTYEFGAAPAVPPTAPEGPKVSPTIIEMGKQ